MSIESRDIDVLVELFESSDWNELHLKLPDFELFLSKDPKASTRRPGSGPVSTAPGAAQVAPATAVTPPATSAGATVPDNWMAIKAPNLGTFYRSPKPGAAPFVEIGQSVERGTEVCVIEVMKLFTTLTAGLKGTVRRVCVKDASLVEFGDTLFYIEPV